MALRNPLVLFIPDPWIRIGWKKTVSPINMFTMLKFISIHFSFNFFYLSPLAIRPLGDCRNHELHGTFCWHLSPNRDSRADAKLLYECRARQSDTHCLEWCVPWQSKRRQCDQPDGMGNSASPFLSKIIKLGTRINYGLSNYLMERMARSLTSCIGWFIDQHGMHSANVGSNKAFNMVQNLNFEYL